MPARFWPVCAKRCRVDAGEVIDWADPDLDTRPVREYLPALA
jgi:hypothetical protein